MKNVKLYEVGSSSGICIGLAGYMEDRTRRAASNRIHNKLFGELRKSIWLNNPNRMWIAILSDAIEFPRMPPQDFP